jgi:hypothetical protein
MQRRHLFEFEDFAWFPAWLRDGMTNYIAAFHHVLDTKGQIAELVARALARAKEPRVLDLCSGGAGPMLDVVERLRREHGFSDVELTLSDLHPNQACAERIQAQGDPRIRYAKDSIDAAAVPEQETGVRTMICSLHHLRPDTARAILEDAERAGQPFVAFELSDNSKPRWLWWLAIPFAFVLVFFVTPLVRPLSWQQVLFTYLIPVIPCFIAWDGAVSNLRTYTARDLRELVSSLGRGGYQWESGTLPGRGGNRSYLLGLPPVPSA